MNREPSQDQDDEAPGLRKLLDEMHGKDPSFLEETEGVDAEKSIESPEIEKKIPKGSLHHEEHKLEAGKTLDEENFLHHQEMSLPHGASQIPVQTSKVVDSGPRFVMPPDHMRHDLERIPVTLDFSLRSMSKTLGEVSQIQQGEIITLGCGPEGPVELKANGRVFAQGRLVMVEDQLAVEIIKKFDDN